MALRWVSFTVSSFVERESSGFLVRVSVIWSGEVRERIRVRRGSFERVWGVVFRVPKAESDVPVILLRGLFLHLRDE